MKISVVIPAYNEEKYITQTLETILNQDYPDFEVIVVDNNSTDNTKALAEKFPVKVVNELKKGTLLARECGRKESKGEIMANLDADCLPEKSWLSRGETFFEDPQVSAVTGPYDYYDASKSYRDFSLWIQRNIYPFFHYTFQLFKKGMIIEGNVLYRASALETIDGFDTLYTFYGDGTDTAKRLSQTGRIIFDRNFIMKTSARRLKSEGALKVSLLYLFYFFKVSFSHNRNHR